MAAHSSIARRCKLATKRCASVAGAWDVIAGVLTGRAVPSQVYGCTHGRQRNLSQNGYGHRGWGSAGGDGGGEGGVTGEKAEGGEGRHREGVGGNARATSNITHFIIFFGFFFGFLQKGFFRNAKIPDKRILIHFLFYCFFFLFKFCVRRASPHFTILPQLT